MKTKFIAPEMVRILNSLSIDMVLVKKGSFMMGESKDAKKVELKEDFYIGKYPITIAEYMHFVKDTNSHHPKWLEKGNEYHIKTGIDGYYKKMDLSDNAPIMGVNWQDAVAYTKWLSAKTGKDYRLPTEEEWKYAFRINTKDKYGFEDDEFGPKKNDKYAEFTLDNPSNYISDNTFRILKVISNEKYTVCKILDISYFVKIILSENDKKKISGGYIYIDIRNYPEIYNTLKKNQYRSTYTKIEKLCFMVKLKVFYNYQTDNEAIYLSDEIFKYAPYSLLPSKLTKIENKLIKYLSSFDWNQYIGLTELTKYLSKKVGISRNATIRILYRWRVFEKIDSAQKSCTFNLKINRKGLECLLSLKD